METTLRGLSRSGIPLAIFILSLSGCNSGPSKAELDNIKHTELSQIAIEIDLHLINNQYDSVVAKLKLLVHESNRNMPQGKLDLGSSEGWVSAFSSTTYRVYWEEKQKSYINDLKEVRK
mgnify:CR=1 FL=1